MLDVNNIENGLWLPLERRFYINKTKYVDRLSPMGQALIACAILSK